MGEDLFRQQALAEFKNRSSGAPVTKVPAAWFWLAVLVVSALVTATLFLNLSEYARKEKAVGWLRYTQGEFAVLAPISGTVEALHQAEGQTVTQGEPLFVIRAPQISTDGTASGAEYARSILAEIELIIARDENARATLRARLEETRERINILNQQVTALDEQTRVTHDRLVLFTEQYQAGVDLASRGVLAQRALEERRLIALGQQEAESALVARRAEYVGAREVQRARLEQIPLEVEAASLLMYQNRMQLERNLLDARAREGALVRAPADGRIAAQQTSAGSSIRAGERALTIVAADSLLQAEIYLTSRAMARIRQGQTVRIYYTAFPHSRYGVASGRIDSISATVFRPEEIPTPLEMEEAAYRAFVSLDSQSIDAFAESFELRSGMTLTAEVVLESQSLFEWLIEPFSGAT